MEEEYRKPYCKKGESRIAVAGAIVACIIFLPAWFFFLWAIGVIVL